MRRLVLSLLIGSTALLCGAGVARAEMKLGYIDSEVLKEQLPELRQVRRQLEQLQQEFERDMADRESKLKKLEDDFRKQEMLMSEKRKAEMQADFQQKMLELQQFGQQKFGPEGELMKKNISLSEPIFARINEALKTIAEEEGYDFIFDAGGGSASIVYAHEKHNLTEQLIERLEEEKKGSGAGVR